VFIQTEETPNPATMKFLPGCEVIGSGTADFPNRESAERSPLATKVFEISEVSGVFLGADFVTVTKSADVDWQVLKPAVLGAIMDHFTSGSPVINESLSDVHASGDGENEEIISQIVELLDTRVRPAVAMDGGDIVFHGFESGVVYLHMQGACSGCPSSTVTLKMGIENLLKHYVPEVQEVQAVP
jgi:Fe-S cluster biogenesis protein NfuA|tara:strand:+ start:857 stop:1411 length:555 start_codon:yes stop_codon:yes gene_type:complete